ncbi:MAG: hypothetical protein V2J55_10950 [Candidatus Competibacteraceae bacterium]|jgi:hypothetical protein|nr:hypothetical protein [Candidatus Competibacteraceae bacterium]
MTNTAKISVDDNTGVNTIEAAYRNLLGRQPSMEERMHLREIQDKLGFDSNDAIWTIFVALEHYHTLYTRFPPMIRAAAEAVLIEYKEQTDATMNASMQRLKGTADQLRELLVEAAYKATQDAQGQLSTTITQSAKHVARQARLGRFWPWLLSGGVIMALALLLAVSVGVGFGRYEGYAKGYAEGWRDAAAQSEIRPQPGNPSS